MNAVDILGLEGTSNQPLAPAAVRPPLPSGFVTGAGPVFSAGTTFEPMRSSLGELSVVRINIVGENGETVGTSEITIWQQSEFERLAERNAARMQILNNLGNAQARAAAGESVHVPPTPVAPNSGGSTTGTVLSALWTASKAVFNGLRTSAEVTSDALGTANDALKNVHYNRNQNNVVPSVATVQSSWRQMSPVASKYHRLGPGAEGNVKYLSPDGGYSEAVIDRNGNLVTDVINGGTYNFAPPREPIYYPSNFTANRDHVVLDVLPFYLWGNGPNDPRAFLQRLTNEVPAQPRPIK